jgi:hypothetical protein
VEIVTIIILVLFKQMHNNQIDTLKIILIIKEALVFQRITLKIYSSSCNKQK